MGANFRLAYQPREHVWAIECNCGGSRTEGTWETYALAQADFGTATPRCGDEYCAVFPGTIVPLDEDADEELMVGVSGQNAMHLVQLLGYGAQQYQEGAADASDFLGRVLLAQGINPSDEGVPAVAAGNWVECGRSIGYSEYRLDQLRTLALAGIAQGREIHWS
jgi:hypothetical protein